MRLARYADGACFVPGGTSEYVEIDGREVRIHTAPAYALRDGSIEPGVIQSPIRTEVRCLTYGADGQPGGPPRFRPLVCEACGDSGDSQRHTWGPCEACHGYGDTKNLHLCAHCGEFSIATLPVAPRAELNHELLLPRMHRACAIASLLDELVVPSRRAVA
jgi:hypothetical protein